jgi:hypothetical protein
MSAPFRSTNKAGQVIHIVDLWDEQKATLDEIWMITEGKGTIDADALTLLKEKCEVAIARFSQDAQYVNRWLHMENSKEDPAYAGRRSAFYQFRRMGADLDVLLDACKSQLKKRDDDCEQYIRQRGRHAKEAVLRGTDQECEPQGSPTPSARSSQNAFEDFDMVRGTASSAGSSGASSSPPIRYSCLTM